MGLRRVYEQAFGFHFYLAFGLGFGLSLAPFSVAAAEISQKAKDAFCDEGRSDRFPEITVDRSMRLGFENAGGLFGGGVCWWHSRFQRAIWHLAVFDPAAPKLKRSALRRLIHKLALRKEVVEIPGYANVLDFSRENRRLIQKELNRWQLYDGVINQAYIRGLSGRAIYRNPKKLKQHLDELYVQVQAMQARREIPWVMLQIKGIASHASLISSMEPRPRGGYRILMVDSNFPDQMVEYLYQEGNRTLKPRGGYGLNFIEWIPFVGLERDYKRIHAAVKAYCEPPVAEPSVMASVAVSQGSRR